MEAIQSFGPYQPKGSGKAPYWILVYWVAGRRYSKIAASNVPEANEGDTIKVSYQSVPYKDGIQNRIEQIEVLERTAPLPNIYSLPEKELRLRALEASSRVILAKPDLVVAEGVAELSEMIKALADEFLRYADGHVAYAPIEETW
ncbi:MAG: hypothetical protein HYV16_00500 [Gammaproteobacteria bacterium]|nr:hypothetical protein [Gammaproteobacteria bacterium]